MPVKFMLMTSTGGSRGILVSAMPVVVLVVIVGGVVGHLAWSAPSTARFAPTSSRSFGSYRPSRPGGALGSAGGSGEYGAGPYGGSGLLGPGAGSDEPGNGSGEGGGGSSGSASGVSGSITSRVDPALVDIDTDLGLEGGEGAATGMVVTSGGEVITNNHVITGATKITATDIGNGTTYTARVVGYDHGHDIAVLQLEGASGLQTVSFGDSTSLQVGQSIATIGNAGGVGGTPTTAAGQVSALDQSITAGDELDGSQEQLGGLIQLVGDVQPGDSGGPLVNAAGEVLGMDTAASTTFQFESSANEGFAIPINDVQTIATLIREGRTSDTVHIGATGILGVLVESQSGDDGALVENVLSGTPATGSGLSAGDVITALDGRSIGSPTALTDVMLQQHPGDSVQVTWETPAGVQQTATVTLADGPPE
jgi:S1-C subfamily serine protease